MLLIGLLKAGRDPGTSYKRHSFPPWLLAARSHRTAHRVLSSATLLSLPVPIFSLATNPLFSLSHLPFSISPSRYLAPSSSPLSYRCITSPACSAIHVKRIQSRGYARSHALRQNGWERCRRWAKGCERWWTERKRKRETKKKEGEKDISGREEGKLDG